MNDNTAICNLCKQNNNLLQTQYVQEMSQIVNQCSSFNELNLGCYDFQVGDEYLNKPISTNANTNANANMNIDARGEYRNNIVFCLEMSPLTVGLNIFATVLNQIRKMVDNDLMDSVLYTDIAIITYNSSI